MRSWTVAHVMPVSPTTKGLDRLGSTGLKWTTPGTKSAPRRLLCTQFLAFAPEINYTPCVQFALFRRTMPGSQYGKVEIEILYCVP